MQKIRNIVISLLLGVASLPSMAQETTPQKENSIFIGVGSADILDTYLSPYSYKGVGATFALDLRQQGNRFVYLHDFQVMLANAENPAKNADDYAGSFRYSFSMLRPIVSTDKFELNLGGEAELNLGCVWNDRNGNNPAQAKLSLLADAAAEAAYRFNLFRKPFRLRYRLSVPLLGVAYSPDFGQSYYEEFILGNGGSNVKFANPANTPSLRQRLLLEIPKRFYIGYECQINQSKYNHLHYHHYGHYAVFGWRF